MLKRLVRPLLISASFAFFSLPACPTIFTNTGHFPHVEDFHSKQLRSIGRLYDLDAKVTYCTATLVAVDVIITANHCVYDQTGKLLLRRNDVFVTGALSVEEGTSVSLVPTSVGVLTMDWYDRVDEDFAFVKLAHSLDASDYPPLGIASPSEILSNIDNETWSGLRRSGSGQVFVPSGQARVSLTAFFLSSHSDGDTVFPTTEECDVVALSSRNNLLRHNCSTDLAASGSPIYISMGSKLNIVGIHSGASANGRTGRAVPFTPADANRGASGDAIILAFKRYQNGELFRAR